MTEEHAAADLGSSVWDLYQRYLVPAIFGPWAEDILKLAKLGGGERVLDVACGTGVVARGAREALGSGADVVGCDINPDTLRVARSASAGLAIEWRQADACSLPFPDSDFDVVLCQQGLQFFPDRAAALSEMRRVLRDGGRVVLAVWSSIERSPGFRALADAIERHMSAEAANRYRHGPFGYGRMVSLERELTAVGFVSVSVDERNKTVRFPSAQEFVRRYVGSPLPSASS
ncbi:MAG TPA: methyltransferase domain-containing protein, partial [Actinomycetes bacterium]|nr:methyltransferase domain-containing protein [Actinomycetes bacterium]